MWKKIIELFSISFLLLGVILVSAGCPGRSEAKIKINYSFNPEISGIELAIGYDCVPNSLLHFGIRNYKNNDILVYIDGNGTKHEIWPEKDPENLDYNKTLPYCGREGGYCLHEMKCSAANASINKNYTCFGGRSVVNFQI